MINQSEEIGKDRKKAIYILRLIEKMLEKYDITIPSKDREARKKEDLTRIYGEVYYELEDRITDIIKQVNFNV